MGRNAQGAPYVPPSYPAGHYDHHEHGYSFQNINGQYVNTGKRKRRAVEIEDDAQDNEDYLKNSKKEKEGYSVEIKVKPEDAL